MFKGCTNFCFRATWIISGSTRPVPVFLQGEFELTKNGQRSDIAHLSNQGWGRKLVLYITVPRSHGCPFLPLFVFDFWYFPLCHEFLNHFLKIPSMILFISCSVVHDLICWFLEVVDCPRHFDFSFFTLWMFYMFWLFCFHIRYANYPYALPRVIRLKRTQWSRIFIN